MKGAIKIEAYDNPIKYLKFLAIKDFSSNSRIEKYRDFLNSNRKFLKKTLNFDTFSQICDPDTAAIAIRHDVDGDLNTALKMAKIEHGLGIKSTFFILPSADYFPKGKQKIEKSRMLEILLVIQGLEHEIGLHNDSLADLIKYGTSPKIYLENNLNSLRACGLVIKGTSSHGSFHSYNAANYEIFNGQSIENRKSFIDKSGRIHPLNYIDMSSLDLSYEANQIIKSRFITRNMYRIFHHNLFDCQTSMTDQMDRNYAYTLAYLGKIGWILTDEFGPKLQAEMLSDDDVIKFITNSGYNKKMVIDVHPEYFGNSNGRSIAHMLFSPFRFIRNNLN